ncbi:MAG: glycosyltransferase family 1 protein [Pseudomonadota bacterium]
MISDLRVALFSGNYSYQRDGANKALNKLVAYLERQGIPVLVFSPTVKSAPFEHDGTLVSAPSFAIPGRSEYRLGLPLNAKLKRDILAFAPSLIHLSAPDWLNHSALSFAERENIPRVASFHTRFDTYLDHYGLGWLAGRCRDRMAAFYGRCDEVFVPCQSMADALREEGILDGPTKRWGRGIDHGRFSREYRDMDWRRAQGFKDTDVVVSFVGRLVREKGLCHFADMMDQLHSRGLPVKALIVGDGPEKTTVAKRLPGAVMTGHVSGTDLSRAYASSDLFINPSLTETFGNVTLEAMASGVAAICAEATGSADLIEHNLNGLLVEKPNGTLLANAAARLIESPDHREKLAYAGRQTSHHYDWDSVLAEVVEGYLDVVGLAESDQRHRAPLAA